jgi:hypothetical protein
VLSIVLSTNFPPLAAVPNARLYDLQRYLLVVHSIRTATATVLAQLHHRSDLHHMRSLGVVPTEYYSRNADHIQEEALPAGNDVHSLVILTTALTLVAVRVK